MTEWFEEWFGDEYLELYPHRDEAEAAEAIALIGRATGMRPGWRVLDVACGPGRHARAFEAAGARPVGLDLSMALLRHAQRTTRAPLVRADMRTIPIRPRSMDLTVNLFTSFGYFADDRAHARALGEMVATVRPGGWFAIDFLNADTVRRTLVPAEKQALNGRPVEVRRRISPDGCFVEKSITTADGRRFVERVRLFTPDEIERLLVTHGVVVRARFGDYAGRALEPGAPRTILVGQPEAP
ncbi:MAG TPA: methyltransferase domain-containing protein [Gemmatimonadales bacterium]|nr:methyltransferase domain-containing protein [Gemmatimonadales bacterium]